MDTGFKVMEDLMSGRNAERVGLMDWPWPDTVFAWVQQGYPTRKVYKKAGENIWRKDDGLWERAKVEGEYAEPVPPWEYFGYDIVNTANLFDPLPLRNQSGVYKEVLEETDAWEVYRNGAGAVFKYWKHKSGTPEHISFSMISREIWEKDYFPHLLKWDVTRFTDLDNVKNQYLVAQKNKRWTLYNDLFIWEIARQSMGDIALYESLLLDPEWIHGFNRVYTDMYKKYYSYLITHVAKPDSVILCEDLGYKNGPFASPKLYEELLFPYYKEIVDFFHQHNVSVILHSCGSTTDVLPLIVDAGFDALNPIERKAVGNDPYKFAEKYSDRIVFVGGLDIRIFETNDKDIVRKETANYIEGMKARGARLVFASDHSIPPTVHLDTYCHIVDAYHEHMMY